jgi:hypothetical protein
VQCDEYKGQKSFSMYKLFLWSFTVMPWWEYLQTTPMEDTHLDTFSLPCLPYNGRMPHYRTQLEIVLEVANPVMSLLYIVRIAGQRNLIVHFLSCSLLFHSAFMVHAPMRDRLGTYITISTSFLCISLALLQEHTSIFSLTVSKQIAHQALPCSVSSVSALAHFTMTLQPRLTFCYH